MFQQKITTQIAHNKRLIFSCTLVTDISASILFALFGKKFYSQSIYPNGNLQTIKSVLEWLSILAGEL